MSDIRFVLSEYAQGILAYSIDVQSNRLETVSIYPNDYSHATNLGDIFIAKVINVSKNINAAFIDYQKGQRGFLPLDDNYMPVLLNREYNGSIKVGDELIVQLETEAVRSKDPVFTVNLALSGKYSVVTNANKKKGVSKKCSKAVREKLLKIIPEDNKYGIILRTNAGELIATTQNDDAKLSIIETELRQLCSQMDILLTEGIHRTCYSKIWQAPPPYITLLRDRQNLEYSSLITDSQQLYEQLSVYLGIYVPELQEKLTFYTDSYPLQKRYSIETKLEGLLKSKVWLKSGAYLVIEKTEAMYVIDVNSGKNISKKVTSEYVLSINMEAAKEIMYQIRLRNLTGMILVDFINMDSSKDREALLHELRQHAKQDRIPTTIVDMTALELVEITRQKNYKSLSEQVLAHFQPYHINEQNNN